MKLFHYKTPIFAQFEITYACNSNCIFCYNPYRDTIIQKEIIWKIANVLKKNKIPLLQITGGECSLFEELPELIKFLSKNSSVTIVTNGIIKVNLPNKTSGVFVSLHGLKETHEKLTNNPNTYEKILTHIQDYVNEGFDVSADTILTSLNYKEIYSIAEIANKLGMKRMILNRYQIGGIGTKNFQHLLPSMKQFKAALTQVIRARKEIGIPIIFGTSIPFCTDKRLIKEGLARSCGAGISYCVIDPYGNLRICNQSTHVYGNILKTPLKKIWNSKKLDDFRSMEWLTPTCKKCKFALECRGGCKVDATTGKNYYTDTYARNLKKTPSFTKVGRETQKIKDYNINLIKNSDFRLSRFVKIKKEKNSTIIVTQWNVFKLNELGEFILELIRKGIINGLEIASKAKKSKNIDEKSVYRFLGLLCDISILEKVKTY